MQQADAAVSNRETRCMKVGTLLVIQRVAKHKIVIGKNIGLVNKISCGFGRLTQKDTNPSSFNYGN
jgi:GTPase Era involved in 16S rRNA processing